MTEVCDIQYDHLQFFLDKLKPLDHYKAIEEKLNAFGRACSDKGIALTSGPRDTAAAREQWQLLGASVDPSAYCSQRQDLVEQMLYGFGWCVTGIATVDGTTSVVLATDDSRGIKFVLTAPSSEKESQTSVDSGTAAGGEEEKAPRAEKKAKLGAGFRHFSLSEHARFSSCHQGAQGVAVLGFRLPRKGDLQKVLQRFKDKHPNLLAHGSSLTYEDEAGSLVEVLDVFAYYKAGGKDADQGTVIRFTERQQDGPAPLPLPGLVPIAAEFCALSGTKPCFADHWVSNVFDREGFLGMLQDTLGFTPKVDFNAGVVAAGEAQIESTVTGNASSLVTADPALALADQGQVFLPINNALSPVGHVHWYLEELGQGIQHVAARVESLPDLVQRANDFRDITGEGFTFLNIPRTYYGLLDTHLLTGQGVSSACAAAVLKVLSEADLVDDAGAVALSCVAPGTGEALLHAALTGGGKVPGYDDGASGVREKVLSSVRRSVYVNMHKLLGDQVNEDTYLSIVRNKILIDVQGNDVLMQIFTSCVLQREAGKEAPFLEFIQRLCNVKPSPTATAAASTSTSAAACAKTAIIRPGCGGFGIRNFLTLFLSIEVSKAMFDKRACVESGDEAGQAYHAKRVALFTEQLVESNPILTEISDSMTGEGRALLELEEATASNKADKNAAEEATTAAAAFSARKENANKALQVPVW